MYDKFFYKCDVTCSLHPPLSQTVTPSWTPSPPRAWCTLWTAPIYSVTFCYQLHSSWDSSGDVCACMEHTYMRAYIHILYTHKYILICVHTYILYTHKYILICVHTYIYTDTHTYLYACIHTYIHTHTYILMCMHEYLHGQLKHQLSLDIPQKRYA